MKKIELLLSAGTAQLAVVPKLQSKLVEQINAKGHALLQSGVLAGCTSGQQGISSPIAISTSEEADAVIDAMAVPMLAGAKTSPRTLSIRQKRRNA
ncbi:hypothetical protein [Neorhizobium sp. DAR64872/K0K18]|uniref:hypothetical protein n=1 Tax=Neorhizobium sp. DAR64872/K0K18 TaxID=3421958 RepID=UPI003D29932E